LSKSPALFIALFAATLLKAEEVDPERAVRSLIDAELGYNKLAQEKNFAAASVQNFAEEGVAFAPGPVNGRKYWSKETEPPLLSWRPVFATIARSGELGYTTGPWEFRNKKDDAKPAAVGQYNTLWRKNGDGVWKVVLDLGVDQPHPTDAPDDVETFVPDFPIARPESVRERWDEAQKSFADLLMKDAGAAVLAKAGDQIRVYRKGAVPAVGKDAAQLMLSSDHGKETRTRVGGGMSRSSDLAYSYGDYSGEHANATEKGIYLSIWQLDLSSEWKLVLDLQKKAPAPK
jgi:ketosteroid isomerase-like protein